MLRLLTILKCLKCESNIYAVMIKRYFIKQSYVQVVLDLRSFYSHHRSLIDGLFKLPEVIFESLNENDKFGF